MRPSRWFFALVAPAMVMLFAPSTTTTVAATGVRPPAMDRPAQRDVMRHLRDGAPLGPVVRLGERNDAAVKTYLTRLRDRYSSVLDRPWDSKYANHRNVKQWSR